MGDIMAKRWKKRGVQRGSHSTRGVGSVPSFSKGRKRKKKPAVSRIDPSFKKDSKKKVRTVAKVPDRGKDGKFMSKSP